MSPPIALRGVRKLFGQVRALDELDLDLDAGVTGLLGPNGSGKSTLIKLIAGQLRPDTGSVRVWGADPFATPAIFADLGLCPEQDHFYEDMRGREFIAALARLHGATAADAGTQADRALARVGMERYADKRLRAMSRGMRQRTKIAQAIAHDPAIVLLDEPLSGTDPVGRADLIALIRELGDEGRCVIVSSHVLHEVESMTRQVVLIRHGRLRAQGDITRLRTLLGDRPYRIQIGLADPLSPDERPADPRRLAAGLIARPEVRAAAIVGEREVEVTTTDLDVTCREIPALADALGFALASLTSPDADLESLYHYLIQR
jgi:ABC-2 type transport system ATP-binding protein